MKIAACERRSLWHKYVSIAVPIYNTSYHASIGLEPSRVFHAGIPYNFLDLKMVVCPQIIPAPDSQITQDVLEQTELVFQDVRKKAIQPYIKYKAYYVKKANASKLKQVTFTSYNQKWITKEAKFFSQTSDGLDPILSKRWYQTTIIWYSKLAPIGRKYLVESGCANSQSSSPHQIYKSHHMSRNQTRKL